MATVPENMREVTKEEFFRLLYADPRDIMPNHVHREFTTWETKSRAVWGWTSPGWASPHGTPQIYAVAAS